MSSHTSTSVMNEGAAPARQCVSSFYLRFIGILSFAVSFVLILCTLVCVRSWSMSLVIAHLVVLQLPPPPPRLSTAEHPCSNIQQQLLSHLPYNTSPDAPRYHLYHPASSHYTYDRVSYVFNLRHLTNTLRTALTICITPLFRHFAICDLKLFNTDIFENIIVFRWRRNRPTKISPPTYRTQVPPSSSITAIHPIHSRSAAASLLVWERRALRRSNPIKCL